MFTYGGIITNDDINVDSMGLDNFDFIRNSDESYEIKVPNLTRKEIDLIDKHIFESEEALLSRGIISPQHLENYKRIYKYIPHLYNVTI